MRGETIAEILLSGPFEKGPMSQRLKISLNAARFTNKLVERILENFGSGSRPSVRKLGEWIEDDKKFQKKCRKGWSDHVTEMLPAEMAPDMRVAAEWKVPTITTTGNLAHWLDLPVSQIDWYAGAYGAVAADSKLSHYTVGVVRKQSGGCRILEKPKWQMKQAQRHILHGILDRIPPHPSSHGFQKHRSILTYVRPHVGKRTVIKFDLKNYFLSIEKSRVRALFHMAGYPPTVSTALAGLCTHRLEIADVPRSVSDRWKFTVPHLPQGAPSSPALADRLLFRLDLRLHGLAEKMGLNYTRYADDLAFSTDEKEFRGKRIEAFVRLVGSIIGEEGFSLNTKKTRVMFHSQRQRLAGLVINQRANVERSVYDQLRAIIHRCIQHGPEHENREGHPAFLDHLQGRVEFVRSTNPTRGEKLQAMLDRVG
ncbi:hypothetical protein NT6N_37540 [Oceaniferula spumae]|uniref:RNA-directed DNA polymerase n=1 Tax=Oceaniferula spumae TaxID=2979115 RepID=A0AAT9FS32_9BACT